MIKVLPLSAELQKVAIDELGEVPSRLPEDIQALKQWAASQPHLKARTDDQFLIQFLRGCKYSLEKAKQKLDLYFSFKTKYPELFNNTNVDDPIFREFCRSGTMVSLPEPINGTGPRVIVFQINYDSTDHHMHLAYKLSSGLHEYILNNDPYACIQGLVYIYDMKKATAAHYLKLPPVALKQLITFHEKCLPLRIKSVYYINATAATQQLFKIAFPFVSEKLRQRIHIMGSNYDDLIKDTPLQYLPRDFGGAQPALMELSANYDKLWDANRQYFKDNALYGTNEELRQGKPLDLDGLFGVGGSFRKITVD